jgi:hypothetical protein
MPTQNHAAFDLEQFIRSTGELYPLHKNIWKNLATKRSRGEYKHDLAVKGFGHLVDEGIKHYVKEFRISHPRDMFDLQTRKLVAKQLTESFEAEDRLGNYDYLLPEKYKTKARAAAHARKKAGVTSQHVEMHSPSALRSATDRQLRGFYREEKHDVEKARAEASRRGLTLHARQKSPAQLDREIAHVVPAWSRGGR